MEASNLQQLASVVDGRMVGNNVHFNRVSTDTRSIEKGDLFFALQGEKFDANTFVSQAKSNGAIAAVVSDETAELPCVVVNDTTKALGQLAHAERLKLNIPLVAITGSNGKTTVKEMLLAILSQSFSVLATQGNLNNHIGVPLTLLRLTAEHQVAIVEMGASHAGEIAYLCELAKPGFAVINNIGEAHLEGFGSVEGIARAKAEIIDGLSSEGVAILNHEDEWFGSWMDRVGDKKLVSFGWSDHASVWAQRAEVTSQLVGRQFKMAFKLHYRQEFVDVQMNLLGEHNVQNALAAASVAIALGVSLPVIATGLASVLPVGGRMEPLAGIGGSLIVNDGYNASPNSFKAALSCVMGLNKPTYLVLGDFAELGETAQQIHQQLGALIADSDVKRVFAIGEQMKSLVDAVNVARLSDSAPSVHFSTKAALVDSLLDVIEKDCVVLVKGSRSQGLEDIVEQLLEKEGA